MGIGLRPAHTHVTPYVPHVRRSVAFASKSLCRIRIRLGKKSDDIFLDKEGDMAHRYTIIRAGVLVMKIVNSLKTIKLRHKGCRVIRRKGRNYVINKAHPRFKARQG